VIFGDSDPDRRNDRQKRRVSNPPDFVGEILVIVRDEAFPPKLFLSPLIHISKSSPSKMFSYPNLFLVAGFLSLAVNALQLEGLHFPTFRSGIDLETLSGSSPPHYNITPRAHDVPHRIAKRALTGQPIPFRYSESRIPLIDILVGDPPQNVTVQLDTGSAWTWFKSVGNNSFNRTASRTWNQVPDPRNETHRYADGRSCNVTVGKDFVSVGTFTVDLLLGSELGNSSIEMGILGLSPNSQFGAEILKLNYTDNVFSFAFKDEHTGEGKDLFEVCGYAGLDPKEVIWLDPTTQNPELYNKHFYTVDFWYATTPRTVLSWTSGKPAPAIVDTGSSVVFLNDEIWGTIFNDTPRFIKQPFRPEFAAQFPVPPEVQMPLVNLTGLEPYEYPSFVMKLDRLEWVMEIGNPNVQDTVEQICDVNGSGLLGPAILPLSAVPVNETMIIGQTFWHGLKGMVFEFTPGTRRVGFVPRNRWKNGLLNPVFMPLDKELQASGKSEEKSVGTRSLRVSLSVTILGLSTSLAVSIFL
jgi:Eukaryotic aspartyl protease